MSLRFLQQRACALMGVGREGRGSRTPLDFEIFSKKGVFISPLLTPLEKFWKNPLVPPPEKNPSDAHVRTQHVLVFCLVITMLITTWCSLVKTAP